MAVAGTVTVDLEARVAHLEADMGRAAMIADRKCKEIANSFKTLAVGVAGYFSGKAILDWLQSSIDAADEISKMSQKVGINTETLSGWTKAAQQAGVQQDALTTGLVKLAKAQDDARAGNKQSVADLQRVGLTMKDIQTGDLASNFEKISEHISKYADGASKAAAVTKAFGKAGADLIPLLNGGAAGLRQYVQWAKAYGFAVGEDGAKAAEAFNDSMAQLKFVGEGVATTITQKLTPSLTKLADKANAFFQSEQWKKFLDDVATAASYVADHIDDIIRAVELLAKIWAVSFGASMIRSVTDLTLKLIAMSLAVDANGKAVSGWAATTSASFSNAAKNIGKIGIALNVLGAAVIGWQIGTYLQDQFFVVKAAGIALVNGLMVAWREIQMGASMAWAAMVDSFDVAAAKIKSGWGSLVGTVGRAFDALGATDTAAKLNAYASSMGTAAAAVDNFKAHQRAIYNEAQADIQKLNDQFYDQYAVEKKIFEQRGKAAAAAPAVKPEPKKPPLPGPTDVAGIQKTQDALKSLSDQVDAFYAKNLETGDKVQDQQAASLRQLDATAAKALDAGAKLADVQALVAKGSEQIALAAEKQRQEESRAFDDYIAQQREKLRQQKEDYALTAASVGMSDKEIKAAQDELAITRDLAKATEDLNKARDKKTIDQAEYDRRVIENNKIALEQTQALHDAQAQQAANQADYMLGAQRAYKNFMDTAADVATQTSQVIDNVFSGFTDAFANMLTTGKADFKSFAISVLSDLAKMETRIAMSKILSSFFGGSTLPANSDSAIGGYIDSVLNAKGNVFAGRDISALSGHVYNQPTYFARGGNVLGEAGYEGVLPLARNAQGKLGVMSQGAGGGNSVNVVVNIDNSGTSSTTSSDSDQARSLGNLIASKVKEVITSEQRPGGMLWRQAHA